MTLRFGIAYDFRNPAQWRRPWSEVYTAMLEQAVYAESLGFDSVWITEHHFAEDGYTPAPVPLMAALAARTTRMELGTDILLLPLYHALRLAEEVATIDVLSGGRAMLGIGMGYRDEEFAAFGTNRRQRVGRTEEGIAVLRGAWAGEPFTFRGRHYAMEGLDVTPKPAREGGPPLWLASASEPAARRAARLGLHLLPQGDRRTAYAPWLDELAKLGKSPDDYRIGLIKPLFVAESRDDPVWREVAERERYRWETYRPWIQAANFAAPPDEGEPEPIDQRWVRGSAGEIVDTIGRFREWLPITEIITWGCPPGMHPDEMRPHLERLARDVMPQLR